MLHYVQENSCSEYSNRNVGKYNIFREVTSSLKCVCLKLSSFIYCKEGKLKNILLHFYITEKSLSSECLRRCSQVYKGNRRQMPYKNRL